MLLKMRNSKSILAPSPRPVLFKPLIIWIITGFIACLFVLTILTPEYNILTTRVSSEGQ